MEFKPTLEIAENAIKQCVEEFNKTFSGSYVVGELENLKQQYELDFKSQNGNYMQSFKMFTVLEVVLIIAEVLCLDKVENLTLSDEEVKIAAQELYERWV